eukprot:scaffold195196_cov19-Tisochrysis_lutea.AAC.1
MSERRKRSLQVQYTKVLASCVNQKAEAPLISQTFFVSDDKGALVWSAKLLLCAGFHCVTCAAALCTGTTACCWPYLLHHQTPLHAALEALQLPLHAAPP